MGTTRTPCSGSSFDHASKPHCCSCDDEDELLPGVLESPRKTFCAADDRICESKALAPSPFSYGSVSELLSCSREQKFDRMFSLGHF